jgi:hypothetical protein
MDIKKEFRSFLKDTKNYNLDKIKEEDEIIKEMAIAGKGDWKPSKDMISSITKFILDNKWEYISEQRLGGFIYRIYKQKNTYIAGYHIEDSKNEIRFDVEFEIKLSEDTEVKSIIKSDKKVMNVDKVLVQETSQGRGIATMMYKFLVKHENIVFNSIPAL